MSGFSAFSLVQQFIGQQNVIAVPVPLLELSGDHAAACFLAQVIYWSARGDEDGWFWKTHEQWAEELGLTRYALDRCMKLCKQFVEVERRGMPARNFYRAKHEVIGFALAELATATPVCCNPAIKSAEVQQSSLLKSNNQVCCNSAIKFADLPQTVPYIHKLPTETTSIEKDTPLTPQGGKAGAGEMAQENLSPSDLDLGNFSQASSQAIEGSGNLSAFGLSGFGTGQQNASDGISQQFEDFPRRGAAAGADGGADVANSAAETGQEAPSQPLGGIRAQSDASPPLKSDSVAKSKKRAAAKKFDPLQMELPECVPAEVWTRWVAYRNDLKKHGQLTEQAARITLSKLQLAHENGWDVVDLVDTAIESGWARPAYEKHAQPCPYAKRPVATAANSASSTASSPDTILPGSTEMEELMRGASAFGSRRRK